jgi:hypothetical protein
MATDLLKLTSAGLGAELTDPQFLKSIETRALAETLFLQLATVLPAARETVNLPGWRCHITLSEQYLRKR